MTPWRVLAGLWLLMTSWGLFLFRGMLLGTHTLWVPLVPPWGMGVLVEHTNRGKIAHRVHGPVDSSGIHLVMLDGKVFDRLDPKTQALTLRPGQALPGGITKCPDCRSIWVKE